MTRDTTQLKALRDAAQEERLFQSTQHSDNAHVLWLSAAQMVSLCERAIASLEAERAERLAKAKDAGLVFADNGDRINEQFREMTDALETPAAEQPKPCAGFVSRDWMTDEDEPTCARPYCGKPKSAHQQPELCATIPLPESASELPHCSCGYTGWPTPSCSGCGKPLSAEAHQQPSAEQAQQPAYAPALTPFSQPIPVPPPDTLHDKSVLQLMQDCERLAKECDEAKAQHEAALAQARREERERCIRICADRGVSAYHVGILRDALAEEVK